MIPSFTKWIESDEYSALSEPQHKQGENNLNLDGLVDRRLEQIVSELETSGRGSRDNILTSIKNYLSKNGILNKENPAAKSQVDQGLQNQGAI